MNATLSQQPSRLEAGSEDGRARPANVLVLGCHRSGTSALARALNLMGLALPRDLMSPGKGNELGHWESISIIRFNERLLEDLERSWFDPKPLPANWLEGENVLGYLRQARDLWVGEKPGAAGYVLKDPRFSRVGALWRQVFMHENDAPLAIVTCRNPDEVAVSLARRNGFAMPHGLELWQTYMLEAEEATRGMQRVVVHYEDLLADPANTLSQLRDFIGLDIANRDQDIGAAVSSIDLQQNHRRESIDGFFASPKISQDIKDLYRRFKQPLPLADFGFFDDARANWRKRWGAESPQFGPSQLALSRPETFLTRSHRAAERNETSVALKMAEQACVLAPGDAAIKYHLAKLMVKARDFEGAIAMLKDVTALDPHLPNAMITLVQLLRNAGRQPEAAAVAAAAAEHQPGNAALHHLHGEVLIDQGDLAGAAMCICRAIGLAGESAGHAMSLGRLALAAGWPDAAAGHARRAAVLMPDDKELLLQAARMLIKCGDHPTATGILLAMVPKHDAPADVLALLGWTLAAQGRLAEAAARLQAAVQLEPGNASYAQQLSRIMERATKTAAAC